MIWNNAPKFTVAKSKPSKKIIPEELAKSGTEDSAQMALFAWAASMCGQCPQLKWLHAIPNGGSRHVAEATKMVAAGLRKGVLDIFLPWPIWINGIPSQDNLTGKTNICKFAGLYIEMKVEKRRNEKNGGLTEEQIEFIEYAESAGYCCKVCYSWIEARNVILAYLEEKL
jgi:hypothetical protein